MRRLFFILLGVSFPVACMCAIYIVIFFIDRYRSTKYSSNTRIKIYKIIILLSCAATVFISAPFQELFKIDNIGFKPKGEYCYYVKIENCDYNKEYHIPARIEISIDLEDHEGLYGEPHSKYIIHYYIKEAYFDNYNLSFAYENELIVNNSEIICDENDNYWICTLLNERAYYPKQKFNNGITVFDTILLSIKIIVLITAYILLEIENRKSLQDKTSTN